MAVIAHNQRVNGAKQGGAAAEHKAKAHQPEAGLSLIHIWSGTQQVQVSFTMETKLERRPNDLYCVKRGPLLYAVAIQEAVSYTHLDVYKRQILSKEKETSQESLTYLTRALLNAETALLQFSVGYANACLHLNRPAQSLEFNQLLYQFGQGLKEPGKMSYLDKAQVILLLLNAFACTQLGDREQTKEYLRQARQLALRFDAAPSYGLEHHKFITLQPVSYTHLDVYKRQG